MDSLQFDSYASSDSYHSDSSAPRTPSPPSSADPMSRYAGPYKPDADPVRIFDQDQDPDASPYWGTATSSSSHFSAGPRSSLLQELYESDGGIGSPSSPPDMYVEDQAAWSPPQQQQPRAPPHDYTLIRRATFPYVRQDHTNDLPQYPPFLHPADDMPLSAEPASLHAGEYHSPPASYSDFNDGGDPAVKIEEAHHHLLPHGAPSYMHHPMHQHHPQHPHHAPHHQQHHHQQQQQFYRPHQQMHPMGFVGGGGAHPGASLPVQHTDDAASKETQYLRRRCFNCHTTEPPSWRRSTLNPGKIVCNKCGLYERTHLRARPLRFDELRAGNKARKGGAVGAGKKGGAGGKKGGKLAPEYGATPGLVRRSSVSSTGSSAQSGSSDWDDSGLFSSLKLFFL
ncbi:hypothetical protein C8J57DRAFT_1189686 [Mycena rebaudengoi]|nr:hypothetical protein C8J57DRAFT_1189686 [Mycena rebaudengoi]